MVGTALIRLKRRCLCGAGFDVELTTEVRPTPPRICGVIGKLLQGLWSQQATIHQRQWIQSLLGKWSTNHPFQDQEISASIDALDYGISANVHN